MAAVPVPLAGESFTSWMDAVARHSGIGRNELIIRYWKIRKTPSTPSHRLDSNLTDTDAARIEQATGVSQAAIAAMLIRRYRDNGIPALRVGGEDNLSQPFLGRTFIHDDHSRWCPECIRENGGRWFLRWRLAWSYACVEHKVFLMAACPSCRQPQDHRSNRLEARLRCADPGPYELPPSRAMHCGFPLADATAIPVTDPRLLHLQARIDLGFEGHPALPGIRMPRALFYYVHLVDLILLLRHPEMFRDADPAIVQATAQRAPLLHRTGTLAFPRSDPLLVAGALDLADRLIKARTSKAAWFADLAHIQFVKRTADTLYTEPHTLYPGEEIPYLIYVALKQRGVVQRS